MRITRTDGQLAVQLDLYSVGRDLLAVLQGGQAHLGSAVLAVPRTSLADPEERSCTSSVLNQLGHKDEIPCRRIAEALCARTGRVTVCTGGLHWDGATAQQLRQVSRLTEQLLEDALAALPRLLEGDEGRA